MPADDLEQAFHEAMCDIYHKARSECSYTATRFLVMVNSQGGLATAQELLRSREISEGLKRLWECRRLDLSMENLVVSDRWTNLFTEQEIAVARKRLKDLEYTPTGN